MRRSMGGSSGTLGTAAARSSTLRKNIDTFLLGLEWKVPACPHHSLREIIRVVNVVKYRMIRYWRADVVVRGEALK